VSDHVTVVLLELSSVSWHVSLLVIVTLVPTFDVGALGQLSTALIGLDDARVQLAGPDSGTTALGKVGSSSPTFAFDGEASAFSVSLALVVGEDPFAELTVVDVVVARWCVAGGVDVGVKVSPGRVTFDGRGVVGVVVETGGVTPGRSVVDVTVVRGLATTVVGVV